MTKDELIAALRATKAKGKDEVFLWFDGDRKEINKVEDMTGVGGCLDINAKSEDYYDEVEDGGG